MHHYRFHTPPTAMKTRPRSARKTPGAPSSPQAKRRMFTPATNGLLLKAWRAELASYSPYGPTPLPRSTPVTGQKFADLIAIRMGYDSNRVRFRDIQVLGKITYLRRAALERGLGALGDLDKTVREVLAMEDAVARAVGEEEVVAAQVVQQQENVARQDAPPGNVDVVQYNPPGNEAQDRVEDQQKQPKDTLLDDTLLVPVKKARKESKKRMRPPPQSNHPDPEERPALEKRKRPAGGSNEEGNVEACDARVEEVREEPQIAEEREERCEEGVEERADHADEGRENVDTGRENVDVGRERVEELRDDAEGQVLEGMVEVYDDREMPQHGEDGIPVLDDVRELERQVKLGEMELLRDSQDREKEKRDDETRWSRKKRLLEQLRTTSEVLHKIGMRPMVEKLMLRACRLLEDEKV